MNRDVLYRPKLEPAKRILLAVLVTDGKKCSNVAVPQSVDIRSLWFMYYIILAGTLWAYYVKLWLLCIQRFLILRPWVQGWKHVNDCSTVDDRSAET